MSDTDRVWELMKKISICMLASWDEKSCRQLGCFRVCELTQENKSGLPSGARCDDSGSARGRPSCAGMRGRRSQSLGANPIAADH